MPLLLLHTLLYIKQGHESNTRIWSFSSHVPQPYKMGLLLRCNLESWEVKRRRETHDQDTFGPSHYYEKPPACKKGRVGRKSYQNHLKNGLSAYVDAHIILHGMMANEGKRIFTLGFDFMVNLE